MEKKQKKKYLTNNDLYNEIKKYNSNGIISEELHMMFWMMCNNIINRPRFCRYTAEWKEDMITESYLKCIKVLPKFNIEKPNPFSYFTSVISNCYIDFIKSENKYLDLKRKLTEKYIGDI